MATLNSNESITKLAKSVGGSAFDFLTAGAKSAYKAYNESEDGGGELINSILSAHMKEGVSGKFGLDTLDPMKIAGSYMLASGAYRFASGGGVYRDKHGNTDLIGIPFL